MWARRNDNKQTRMVYGSRNCSFTRRGDICLHFEFGFKSLQCSKIRINNAFNFFFFFTYQCVVNKSLFRDQIFEIEIFFSFWGLKKIRFMFACVWCVQLCVCVRYHHNSRTGKIPNLVFRIKIVMLLETFWKNHTDNTRREQRKTT